jgi:magnesium-transporting ATPase (P-type)
MLHTESPSGNLYHFEGFIQDHTGRYPLTVNQLLQRGSTLRNTAEIYGAVVYTGEESKIRMNSNLDAKTKKPALERTTNFIVLCLFFFILLMSLLCSIGYLSWNKTQNSNDAHWYLSGLSVNYSTTFLSFFILFNNLIPISLYVTMEVIKVIQAYYLNNDLAMYDSERDIPAEARTSSLNEDLGQVQYVFTDKTVRLIFKF